MNKLETSTEDTFILDEDLYWNILDEELYDPYKKPENFTMGSLADDWAFLQNVLEGNREMINYDLVKIAAILKFLAQKYCENRKRNLMIRVII
ncbi:hypothetical protein [Chryseobacterium phocaeense]|uniref:hypothetical protein n=1 Tax=Chryseobacterium phocaeense TaxID=1816690 RepID=UPI00111B5A9D|nr:hypothetical protein [Chryseobacterium phocaeense]